MAVIGCRRSRRPSLRPARLGREDPCSPASQLRIRPKRRMSKRGGLVRAQSSFHRRMTAPRGNGTVAPQKIGEGQQSRRSRKRQSGSMAQTTGKPIGHASVQQFAGTQSPGLRRLHKGSPARRRVTEAGHVEPHGPARVGWAFSDGIQIAPANKDGWTRCPGAYEIGLANKFCFRGKPRL
jgi:hypothetical protein